MRKFFLFMALCVAAIANAETFAEGDLYYEIDPVYSDPVCYVYGVMDPNKTVINISGTVTHNGTTYTVMGVRANAFKNNTKIVTVNFTNMYNGEIKQSAFQGCTKLTKISFGMVSNAYGYEIGDFAFQGCTALKELELPKKLLTTGVSSFAGCSALEKVTIRETMEMHKTTFANCNNLKTIEWFNTYATPKVRDNSGTVRDFGNGNADALPYKQGQITKVIAWCDVQDGAFADESKLYTLEMKNSVKKIGNSAFHNCQNLHVVTFSDRLEYIDEYAFWKCPIDINPIVFSLRSPIEFIGPYAFVGCQLSTLEVGSSSADKPTTISRNAFANCPYLTTVRIVGNIKEIKPDAFLGDGDITTLSLNISNDYTQNFINGNSPFSVLKKVTTLTASGAGNWTIGDYMFQNMTGLTSVNLTCANVSGTAFAGCSAIKNVTWKVSNPSDYTSAANPFKDCQLSAISITGNSSTHVPAYLCNGQSKLTSVSLSGCVTVGAYAFANTNFTSLSLPSSVANIGNSAFANSKVNTINLANVKRIDDGAFKETPLKEANLSSVNNLGGSAFEGCTALTKVTMSGFLTKVPLATFKGCTKLVSVTLPSIIKTIEDEAFYNTAIAELTIPAQVTTIADKAFGGISALKTINVNGNPVPSITAASFYNSSNISKIYGNCNNIDALKANAQWVALAGGADKILISDNSYDNWQSILHYDAAANIKSTVQVQQAPGCDGKIILKAVPNSGCTFACWSDNNTSNPRTIELNNWTDTRAFYAISASSADYMPLSVTANPAAGATFRITDGEGAALNKNKILPQMVQTIVIEPQIAEGYEFIAWQYDESPFVTEDANSHALTINVQYDNGAYLCPTTYTLNLKEPVVIKTTVNNSEWGKAGWYHNPGDDTWVIWASPKDKHYAFVGWDDNGDGVVDNTEDTRIVPAESHTYKAFFEQVPLTYNVHVIGSGSGAVLEFRRVGGDGSLMNIPEGQSVTLEAVCDENTIVTDWLVNGYSIGTDNPILLTENIQDDYFVICVIEWQDPYTNSHPVMINWDPSVGDVFVNLSGFEAQGEGALMGFAKAGSTLIVTAEPKPNYKLSTWQVMTGEDKLMSEENPLVIEVPELSEEGPNEILILAEFEYSEGFENIQLTDETKKMLIDGQIYILRGGKIYTVQGSEVK